MSQILQIRELKMSFTAKQMHVNLPAFRRQQSLCIHLHYVT